jgi:hypothetical protein
MSWGSNSGECYNHVLLRYEAMQIGTSIMEEPVAIIFWLEQSWNKMETIGFLWNIGAYLPNYMGSHS